MAKDPRAAVSDQMRCAREEAGLKTSVIKLWCAGWLPQFRLCVRGVPCSYCGRRSKPATKR